MMNFKIDEKKSYVPPKLEVQELQWESSLATGSAIVKPIHPQDEIVEIWEETREQQRDVLW